MIGLVRPRVALLILFASFAACQREPGSVAPPPGSNDDVVLIQAELGAVPGNAKCVRFTTVWGTKMVQQNFTVATGDAGTTLNLTGLPYNQALTISADAFNVACGSIATSPVTYSSDPQPAGPLAPGDSQVLTFVLKPTANAKGMVDFLYLTLSPTNVGYPPTVIGQQSGTMPFTLMNIGAVSTTDLTTTISGTPAQFVVTSSTCPATGLTTRQMCTIQVAFKPTMPGQQMATLQVTALQGGTVTATLSGQGQNPAKLSISPSTLSFGSQMLTTSAQMNFVVSDSNNGNEQPTGPITVSQQAGSSDFHVMNNCGGGIGPAPQTCNISVAYAPTAVGAASGTITVSANPSGGMTSMTVGMNGTGISPLTVTPTPFDYGQVSVGSTGSAIFTFKNNGTAPSNALSISTSNPTIFKLPVPNPCANAVLTPNGGVCNMTLTFAPNMAMTTFMGNLTATAQTGWSASASVQGTAP